MFNCCSFSPQALGTLSQLSSLMNSLKTTTQSVLSGQRHIHRRHHRHAKVSNSSDLQEGAKFAQMSELADKIAEDCGLGDLPSSLLDVELCPLLSASPRNASGHWLESYISANTFFENKNGFPQHHLQHHAFLSNAVQLLSRPEVHGLLQQSFVSCHTQQTRGFKTDRSGKTGVGKVSSLSNSPLDDLRKSVYEKLFPETKMSRSKTDKMRNLLQQGEGTPEQQQKIKVAFAEGYMANDKKEGEPTKNTFLSRTVRVFVYMCVFWLAIQVLQIFSAMGGTGVRGLGVLNREQYEVNPEEITVSFDDVKGVAEAKQELQDVVEFLRDPEKFTSLGAKLPKGVLLVGPPGIGKTLLARAVAGEAGVPFFHASGSEFDEIFVGTGAKRVRQLFSAAKMRAPCVIFIDEIDTVGAKRTSSQIHPYANQTINQLLSEMDGFTQNEGVIVLGATNRRDNLDRALLRPGRFDVEVRVFPPDLKGRQEIFEHYITKIKVDADIDTEKLARGSTGFTGADIENMVNQAALKAAMDGSALVSMNHMEFARDKVLMGPAKKTRIPDDDTNWLTAYHEAGHTIVAYFTKDATPLHKVTIIPRGMSLGHTSFIAEKEVYNKSKCQLLAEMDVAMGGRVAEELVYGGEKVTTGASSDFQSATAIATAMVKRFGMSEKVGVRVFDDNDPFDSGLSMLKVNEVSPAIQEQVDHEIKRILQESYDRSKAVLRTHSSEHKALAQALMKYETLDSEDIRSIIEGKKIKKAEPS
ncbi:ATP-dependent zinc metalloprotease YME1L-like [Liolophura sinensis]|uniref:ATP-dependent zinc metalloprotease YME1L-like n=1 Tax=Liolophura sinensis TaxID=3198878 RepID=UPI003158A780